MPRKKKPKVKIHRPQLFWIGLALFAIFAIYKIHLAVRLSFSQPIVSTSRSSAALPQRITIEGIKLDQPIYPTAIQGNVWQVDDRGISFLSSSARPGENGPIILYSHNTNSRFGPIRWLNKGDTVTLYTTDNKEHRYAVTELLTVKPTQIGSLLSDTQTLVLYTCTGFLDQERFVVKATPI